MKRNIKCSKCLYKGTLEIPELNKVPTFNDIISENDNSFNIKNLECPNCKQKGYLYVPFVQVQEIIAVISSSYPKWKYLSLKTLVPLVFEKRNLSQGYIIIFMHS